MRQLIDYYGQRWKNIEEFKTVQDALEHWNAQLWADKQSFLDQLNVGTATWGLESWETMLGITSHTGTDAARRECILAKLRRTGTTTVEAMKNIARSFTEGMVEVEEYPAQYAFKVIFESSGVPTQIQDFIETAEEVKPAHLLMLLLFRFLKSDTASIYTGVALLQQNTVTISGAEAEVPELSVLLDEDESYLVDENGAWLTED